MAAPQRKWKYQDSPRRWNVFNVAGEIQGDLWAHDKLSGGVEMAILLYIWRMTWANRTSVTEDAPEWTEPISARRLAQEANCSVDMAQRAIVRMRSVGIIASDPASEKGGRSLRYKLTPENWGNAPKYVPKLMPEPDVMPDPETEAAAVDDLQEVLPGLQPFMLKPSEPATLSIERRLRNLRMEIDEMCSVKPDWKGPDLLLKITHRGAGNKEVKQGTSALQCGGQKSGNTPNVERETLRAGLELGGDVDMVGRLYGPLVKAKENAEDFVRFVKGKKASRRTPIHRQFLPKILAEFLKTPADERDLGDDDEAYQRDYELAVNTGDNAAAERCLKRQRR